QAGEERIARGRRGACLGMMEHGGAAGRGRVGDDEPVESPASLQLISQQAPVLRGGDAVHRVVCRHDRSRMAFVYGGLERREMHVFEGARVELYRVAVASAVAYVGHKMLGCGD